MCPTTLADQAFMSTQPTPIASAFLGVCVTAITRGVALGDLVDTITDHPLCGPWVTWGELNGWALAVAAVEPRDDTPDQEWLSWCAENHHDPISGNALS